MELSIPAKYVIRAPPAKVDINKKVKICFFFLSSWVDSTADLDLSQIRLMKYMAIIDNIVVAKKNIRSTARRGIVFTMRRRTFGITIVNQMRLNQYILVNVGTNITPNLANQYAMTETKTLTGVFI
jgi:hypothetical protein